MMPSEERRQRIAAAKTKAKAKVTVESNRTAPTKGLNEQQQPQYAKKEMFKVVLPFLDLHPAALAVKDWEEYYIGEGRNEKIRQTSMGLTDSLIEQRLQDIGSFDEIDGPGERDKEE